MSKITRTTLKSFIKNNFNDLKIKVDSKFDGMVDCVMPLENSGYQPITATESSVDHTLGINGAWFVGHSRDYFTEINTETHKGYEIYNCVGSFELVIEK